MTDLDTIPRRRSPPTKGVARTKGTEMAEANSTSRNVALDNLRVVAMLLGLVTHGVLPFKATALGRYPIRDSHRHVLADLVYFAVHDFRMQLFFLVAGFAAAALVVRRGLHELVRNRLSRILVPLLLSVAVLTPVMHLLFIYHEVDRGTGQVGSPGGGVPPLSVVVQQLHLIEWVGPNFHLWFLYYLLMCSTVLTSCVVLGPRAISEKFIASIDRGFRWFVGRWWKTLVLAAATVPLMWTMTDWWIDTPQGWLPDPIILLYYLGFFLFGTMLYRHADLMPNYGRRWLVRLAVANVVVLPLMLKLTVSGNWAEEERGGSPSPAWLLAVKAAAIFLSGLYTWLTIEGLVGLFQRHFSGSRAWWRYMVGASYWCYLAGFPVQVALQVWLAEVPMPILVKFVLVNVVTFAVLLASYELLVRRSWVGAMLNGRKTQGAPVPQPVVVGVRVKVGTQPAGPRWTVPQPAARTPSHSA